MGLAADECPFSHYLLNICLEVFKGMVVQEVPEEDIGMDPVLQMVQKCENTSFRDKKTHFRVPILPF